MKILVTGSRGWVGQRIIPELKALGYEIKEFDLEMGADHDIENTKLLAEYMEDCDAVFHLAGMRGPDCDFDGANKDDYKSILMGAGAVHDAMKKAGLNRLVYLSTGAIYGTKYFKELPEGISGQDTHYGYIVQQFKWPITDKSDICDNPHPHSYYKNEADKYFKAQEDLTGVSLRVNGIDSSDTAWSTSRYNIADAIDRALKADLDSYEIVNIADATETSQVRIKKARSLLKYEGLKYHK